MITRNIKPRYEVERRDETVIETYYVRDMERKMNVEKQREVPYGYHVYLANGSSIRVATDEELRRLGFDAPAPLIDMDSGEEVGTTAALSLKRQASSRARRADTNITQARLEG